MNVLNAIASRFQQFKNYIWRDKRRAVVLPVMTAFYAVLAHWLVIGGQTIHFLFSEGSVDFASSADMNAIKSTYDVGTSVPIYGDFVDLAFPVISGVFSSVIIFGATGLAIAALFGAARFIHWAHDEIL